MESLKENNQRYSGKWAREKGQDRRELEKEEWMKNWSDGSPARTVHQDMKTTLMIDYMKKKRVCCVVE